MSEINLWSNKLRTLVIFDLKKTRYENESKEALTQISSEKDWLLQLSN